MPRLCMVKPHTPPFPHCACDIQGAAVPMETTAEEHIDLGGTDRHALVRNKLAVFCGNHREQQEEVLKKKGSGAAQDVIASLGV